MKKTLLALLLAMLMIFSALAEEEIIIEGDEAAETTEIEALDETIATAEAYGELTVGTPTAMRGDFFTEAWGNSTSDQDVRELLHAYDPVKWDNEAGTFIADDSVVSGLLCTANEAGDHIYTISLYNDLYYSDGTPITAYDYAFSFLLTCAPEFEAIGATVSTADAIDGMTAYRTGESYVLSGVRVYSDTQFSVTISHEYLPFFYEMGAIACNPYPIAVIAPGCEVRDDGEGVYIHDIDSEEAGKSQIFTAELLRETILDDETGYKTYPAVVSGPYTLTAFDGTTAEFEVNPYYKGDDTGAKPRIAKLIYKVVDTETMMTQLASGELGLINKCVSAANIAEGMTMVTGGEGYAMSNYARVGYSFINCNCERPAMQSVEVRRALAEAFDKDAFVSEYVSDYGARVESCYGIGQWMYLYVNEQEGQDEAEETEAAEEETEAEIVEVTEEAAAETEAEAEAAAEAPVSLTLDGLTVYAFDLESAQQRLIDDGWTLNLAGEAFDPETDTVRCKLDEEGTLMTLQLTLIYPEGNAQGEHFLTNYAENLRQIGVELTVEAVPMASLLEIYYRRTTRECDMIYLATNFNTVFDPIGEYVSSDASATAYTAIYDEQLYNAAYAMRSTEPGDADTYCAHWVDFITRWSEILPTIPVYSNVYFDFYTSELHDYNVSEYVTWTEAILHAYLSDGDENLITMPETEEEADEDEIVIMD